MTETTDRDDADRVRQLRGLELARRFPPQRDGETWIVHDEASRSFTLRVVLGPGGDICTCSTFAEEATPCHHIYAARAAEMRERGEMPPEPEYPSDVPPGSPPWVTPELMRETYRVWQIYYPDRLTPTEVMAMIVAIARLGQDL